MSRMTRDEAEEFRNVSMADEFDTNSQEFEQHLAQIVFKGGYTSYAQQIWKLAKKGIADIEAIYDPDTNDAFSPADLIELKFLLLDCCNKMVIFEITTRTSSDED